MRSLTPTGLYISEYSVLGASANVAGIAIDPETNVGYVALQRIEDGSVEVDVLLMDQRAPSDFPEVIATVSSPVIAPFELPEYRSQVVDIHFFPESRSLVVILAGGDIATVQLESGGSEAVEIVGSVDSGIKAAAWSPDDEQLILVTGDDELVCMNRLFDIIHEEPLRQEDFGEDKFVNVGWGSKATQFHGSLGKAAAKASSSAPSSSTPSSLSHPTDDGLPIITFRGDAAFFAISSLDAYPDSTLSRRQIRIYTCSAHTRPTLSATSESLPGLEGQIDWRPSGNLLSGLVRYGYEGGGAGAKGRWEVAMLERNGLRHGGFPLREKVGTWEKGKVRGMKWNSDSEVLAIWIEREDLDVVQLWTMKNYHYYLKQEIFSHRPEARRFTGLRWHPEQPLTLYILGQGYVQTRSFVWDTFTARLDMPNDTASVAVIDGPRLLITPFRTQNTPPPMSSYVIDLPATPVNVSCSTTDDSVAILFGDGTVQVYDLNTKIPDPKSGSRLRGGGKVAEPKLRWESKLSMSGSFAAKQVVHTGGEVGALFWTGENGGQVVTARDGQVGPAKAVKEDVERLIWAEEGGWLVLDRNGTLSSIDGGEINVDLCAQPLDVKYASKLFFAHSPSGKLIFASLESPFPQNIASSVTSFTLTEHFLIYTTSAQSSHYAPISTLQRMCAGEDVQTWEKEWESRRIERGALAVVACPSSMSLVLQMPRGNLETIYPRPLVLAVVRKDVMRGAYRDALTTCRKHRLDLNLLHDLDSKQFMDSLESFVDQVPEVDYLNLFVSSLTEQDASIELYQDLRRAASSSNIAVKNKVNSICDALRIVLEKRDLLKYVETILTTHVCKLPADYESGLKVLLQLQKQHPDVVEDAVKYIIFLSDVNQLYDVALGMYDFQLVLMVAQYSQKDPKEYLPFLKELRELDKWEQRFRIDDHLERRESALRSLQQAGPERFDDAAEYLARYELYDVAFRLYEGDSERLPRIHDLYGDYLYDRRDFHDSAIAYTLSGKPEKALKAYERAHAWRELFALAIKEKLSKQAIADMVDRVGEYLASRGRHLEAAQVYLEYAEDVVSAVQAVSSGADFAEAYRIATKYNREDLIESAIWPGMDDAQEALLEVFEEMEGQLDKEVARLQALHKLRREDPDTFYIVDHDPDLEGVDVATNATTQASAFTRYTVAPTTAFSATTKMTGQTNRTRHKSSKKRAAGRKGTVDEYEYLLASLNRLIIRVDEKSADAITLMRQLITASPQHRDLAKDLQGTIRAFRARLRNAIEEAWEDREAILDGVTESGGMGLDGGAGLEKAKEAIRGVVGDWKGLGVLVG